MAQKQIELTQESEKLFRELALDAPNWSGTPLVEVSPAERGNLTQLKKAGLLTTWTERERINGLIQTNVWASFTQKGADLATELGIAGVEVTA